MLRRLSSPFLLRMHVVILTLKTIFCYEINSLRMGRHMETECGSSMLIINSTTQPPGINKLLRMHWAVRKKLQNNLVAEIKAAYPCDLIEGPVNVVYTRRSVRLMDWDNAAGSFKLVGDALVKCGILEDDNPKVIKEFKVEQVRVKKRHEQGFEVKISQTHTMP